MSQGRRFRQRRPTRGSRANINVKRRRPIFSVAIEVEWSAIARIVAGEGAAGRAPREGDGKFCRAGAAAPRHRGGPYGRRDWKMKTGTAREKERKRKGQSYSRQVWPHSQQRKNLTSLSSAARSCRSHQNARLCSHLGHLTAMVGSVRTDPSSSTITISLSRRSFLICIWSSLPILRIYPHFRHFNWPAEEIIRLLHSGQNMMGHYALPFEIKAWIAVR